MRRVRCSGSAIPGRSAVDISTIPLNRIKWPGAARISRVSHHRLDHFDDIAEPEDWPLLTAAERATSPSYQSGFGDDSPIPASRRVADPGAGHLMKPFTHVSRDRQSRFSDGSFGVLYAGRTSEVALLETTHHHGRFMAATNQAPGWTSQFQEIALDIDASLHDLRDHAHGASPMLDPEDYSPAQALGRELHASGSDGIAYPSVRHVGGECSALFYPDLASNVREVRHLDYHWNGSRVDFCRDLASGDVYRID